VSSIFRFRSSWSQKDQPV